MPSQIGILMQRDTTQGFCQGDSFDSIGVSLGSDPTAFGGVGTVAVYNNGCELTSLSHDWLNADTPYYGVGAGLVTATVQPPIKGAHGILNPSMKGVSFAQTDLIGMHGPCVWLEGQVYDFSFGNQTYCANNSVITTSSLAGTPFAFILGNGVNGGYWYNVTAESLRFVLLPERKEVVHAYAQHDKARRVFGEFTEVPLQEGIERMARWAQRHGARVTPPFTHIEVSKKMPTVWLGERGKSRG
jgi:hypothetical protein